MIKTFHRGLWILAGLFFLLLGIIGLLLPVVPQLPFFLASILCFMRCSRRFNGWMEKSRGLSGFEHASATCAIFGIKPKRSG